MNEKHRKRSATKEAETTKGERASVRAPLFRILDGGKTQRTTINHQSVLTRMLFTTVIFCSSVLLNSLSHCASVEERSQNSAISSQFSSSSSIRSSSRNPSVVSYLSPLGSSFVNAPPETYSNGDSRRLRRRQVSESEWVFSSLVRPGQPSAVPSEQPSRSQGRRGNPGLTYRSLPMGSYTNYYRNPNIYVQSPRRVDGDDTKSQSRNNLNGISSPAASEITGSNAGRYSQATNDVSGAAGLGRRRASSSLSLMNELSSTSSVTISSKLPEVLSERESGTTGLSRTAPATDPSLFATERPTSTQEMQIPDEESSTVLDDIELGSRAEIGRGRGGMKSGRNMDDATVTFNFENNAPIVFPGTSPAAASSSRGTLRPYVAPGGGVTDRLEMGTFDPFQAKVLDGWKRLHELRKKSQSFEGRKSSITSDQLADAKIISMLTISGTPKCASQNGYCEHIETYPRTFFDQILNKTLSPDIFKGIFGETIDNNSIVTDVEFKLRHDFEDTPLCSVREHTIYPKAAQNRKGKFMYIVNHDEYLQGIRVETCTREEQSCMFTEGHLPGYTSTCKQKFIYKKLLAFTPEGKAMPDTFRLPSCCVCHVRSAFVSDRIHPIDAGSADIHPTQSAGDDSWNPSSSTIVYPHHDDAAMPSSSSPPVLSSTDGDVGITFPTTSRNDLPSFQVPTPTTSTASSQMPVQHQVGDENTPTNIQMLSLRQEFIFIVVLLLLSFLLR